MDARDLFAFLQVYKERSINKAAKSLYMSPQGLSKLITRLENELERTLFIRMHIGVQPTVYADVFKEKAEIICNTLDNLKASVQEIGGDRNYELVIAATYGIFAYLTVDFIIDFKNACPNVSLIIKESSDLDVEEKLDRELAEVGFLGAPFDTGKYNGSYFTTHRDCVVLNKEHPLARKSSITYQDLANQPLVIADRHHKAYQNILNLLVKASVHPHILLETVEIEFVHKIAAMGKAVAISVDFQAFAHPFPNTVIRPFSDPHSTYDVCMVTKKGKVLSEAATRFQAFALDWLKQNKCKLYHWNP